MGGFCQVKAEYIVPKSEIRPTATTESTCSENDKESTAAANDNVVEKKKKQRLSNREYKKMKKGQNKGLYYNEICKWRVGDVVDAPLLPPGPQDPQQPPPQPRRRVFAMVNPLLPRRQFAYMNGRRVLPTIGEAALRAMVISLKSTVLNLRKTVRKLTISVECLNKTVADLNARLERCTCQNF